MNDLEQGDLTETEPGIEELDATEVRPSIAQFDIVTSSVPDVALA